MFVLADMVNTPSFVTFRNYSFVQSKDCFGGFTQRRNLDLISTLVSESPYTSFPESSCAYTARSRTLELARGTFAALNR